MLTNLFYNLLLLSTIHGIFGKGWVDVTLNSYRNPTGTLFNGQQCCDDNPDGDCAADPCDHHFLLCALDGNRFISLMDCRYGRHEYDAQSNQNVIVDLNEVSRFKFDTWQANMTLFIEVRDVDDGSFSFIDSFTLHHHQALASPSSTEATSTQYTLTGRKTNHSSNISLTIQVYCDQDYFGPDCSRHCAPADDCQGHYTCDVLGDIVCLSGFTGTLCRYPQPGTRADCTVYQGAGIGNSTWRGQAECKDVRHNVTFDVSESNDDSKDVAGYVTVDHSTVGVSGSYILDTVVVEYAGVAPVGGGGGGITSLELDGRRTEVLLLTGKMKLNGDTCTFNLVREQAYFEPCKGSPCVRNGKTNREYYCCCPGGGRADRCGSPPQTTRTTSTTTVTTTDYVTTKLATTAKLTTKTSTTSSTSTTSLRSSERIPTTEFVATTTTKTHHMIYFLHGTNFTATLVTISGGGAMGSAFAAFILIQVFI